MPKRMRKTLVLSVLVASLLAALPGNPVAAPDPEIGRASCRERV